MSISVIIIGSSKHKPISFGSGNSTGVQLLAFRLYNQLLL